MVPHFLGLSEILSAWVFSPTALVSQIVVCYLLPFAASFFCNFRLIKKIWRKRVGVERTHQSAKAWALKALQPHAPANGYKRYIASSAYLVPCLGTACFGGAVRVERHAPKLCTTFLYLLLKLAFSGLGTSRCEQWGK
jgi:hypothetical protein